MNNSTVADCRRNDFCRLFHYECFCMDFNKSLAKHFWPGNDRLVGWRLKSGNLLETQIECLVSYKVAAVSCSLHSLCNCSGDEKLSLASLQRCTIADSSRSPICHLFLHCCLTQNLSFHQSLANWFDRSKTSDKWSRRRPKLYNFHS